MSLDKYERIRVLGKGTFGRAWLVRDKHTKEELVAKEIKVENKQVGCLTLSPHLGVHLTMR